VRDLGIPLLSVQSIETEQMDAHNDDLPHHSGKGPE